MPVLTRSKSQYVQVGWEEGWGTQLAKDIDRAIHDLGRAQRNQHLRDAASDRLHTQRGQPDSRGCRNCRLEGIWIRCRLIPLTCSRDHCSISRGAAVTEFVFDKAIQLGCQPGRPPCSSNTEQHECSPRWSAVCRSWDISPRRIGCCNPKAGCAHEPCPVPTSAGCRSACVAFRQPLDPRGGPRGLGSSRSGDCRRDRSRSSRPKEPSTGCHNDHTGRTWYAM
jgi:hypothetical protein